MFEASKALVRRYVEEILNQGAVALVDELFSADTLFQASGLQALRGREARKDFQSSLRRAFPDLHYRVDELIAEGDKVVMRWSFEGTHKGEWLGVSPTGKKVRSTGTSTFRIGDGAIAEELVHWDALGFMQQVGAVPLQA